MGKLVDDFKNRFKDKGINEYWVAEIFEQHGAWKGMELIREKYPQASDQDIDDLIGRYAITPYKYPGIKGGQFTLIFDANWFNPHLTY